MIIISNKAGLDSKAGRRVDWNWKGRYDQEERLWECRRRQAGEGRTEEMKLVQPDTKFKGGGKRGGGRRGAGILSLRRGGAEAVSWVFL